MTIPLKNLVILLNHKDALALHPEQLFSLFPLLEVTSDIYIVSKNFIEDASRIKGIVKQVGDFLHQQLFYRINVHPVHPFPSSSSLTETYTDLLGAIRPFIQEAYLHQSVSRLMVLPIIKIIRASNKKRVSDFLRFLRERNMIPSIYIPEGISYASSLKLIETDRERIYLELGEGNPQEKIIRTLCAHFEFDDLLMWVNTPAKTELPVCRSLVFSEKDLKVYICSMSVIADNSLYAVPSKRVSEIETLLVHNEKYQLSHHIEILHSLKETLKINNREREGANIFFHLGLEYLKREGYQKALEQFNEVLAAQKGVDDQSTVFLSKALCLLRLHDIESAQDALNEAERQNPSLAMIYFYRGQCEFELKDYIEAIDMFQKSLEMGPEQVPLGDVYFYMGLSHINIMEYDEGLTMMREAEKFYKKDQISPVIYYTGVCYLGKNDIDTAYQFFKKALRAHPKKEDLSSIYLYLGICHKGKGEYDEALKELNKGRNVEGDRLEIHNLMGFCYFKLKDYDKAIECFVRAVEINPASAIDWANLGVNVKAKGEDEKAVILFKKSLGLDPTIGFAKKHLRELLEKGNK